VGGASTSPTSALELVLTLSPTSLQAREDDAAPLTDVNHLLVVAGNSDEENPYRKGSALQTHLLGYEFPSTLMLLTDRTVYFVVSSSKGPSFSLSPRAVSYSARSS